MLTPVEFNLTNLAGSLSSMEFIQQPRNAVAGATLNSVQVRAQDGYSNPIVGASVAMTLQGDAATLNGTLVQTTNSTGIAVFNDLHINTLGSYSLNAGAASVLQVPALTSPRVYRPR